MMGGKTPLAGKSVWNPATPMYSMSSPGFNRSNDPNL